MTWRKDFTNRFEEFQEEVYAEQDAQLYMINELNNAYASLNAKYDSLLERVEALEDAGTIDPPPPPSPLLGLAVQGSDATLWDSCVAELGVTPGMARVFDSNDLATTVDGWPVGPFHQRGVDCLVSFKTSPE